MLMKMESEEFNEYATKKISKAYKSVINNSVNEFSRVIVDMFTKVGIREIDLSDCPYIRHEQFFENQTVAIDITLISVDYDACANMIHVTFKQNCIIDRIDVDEFARTCVAKNVPFNYMTMHCLTYDIERAIYNKSNKLD